MVFPDASPFDGMLEVGVVTASSTWQWVRVFSRVARGHLDRSPFIEMTRGRKIVIELGKKVRYELDGGVRPPEKRLEVRVKAGAITICVPASRKVARPPQPRARVPRPGRASSLTPPVNRAAPLANDADFVPSPPLSPSPCFDHERT